MHSIFCILVFKNVNIKIKVFKKTFEGKMSKTIIIVFALKCSRLNSFQWECQWILCWSTQWLISTYLCSWFIDNSRLISDWFGLVLCWIDYTYCLLLPPFCDAWTDLLPGKHRNIQVISLSRLWGEGQLRKLQYSIFMLSKVIAERAPTVSRHSH